MWWHIKDIHRLWNDLSDTDQILPTASFTLVNDQGETQKASGWLPCHYSNIHYRITLSRTGRILHILQIKKVGPKQLPTRPRKIVLREKYDDISNTCYKNDALWPVFVAYPMWWLKTGNLEESAQQMQHTPHCICLRESCISLPSLLYNEQKAIECVRKIHTQLNGQPPDESALKQIIQWQMCTRSNTGSMEKPGDKVPNVQKFQEMWTNTSDILHVRKIANALTPTTCSIIRGSPCPSMIPQDAIIVVRSLEDAYKWKCYVEHGKLHLLEKPNLSDSVLIELGVKDINILESHQHVYVAWSHLWGVEEWCSLIDREPVSYTCIGRLDQYPNGRGQVFRDMCESDKFPTTVAYHHGSAQVVMVQDQVVDQEWIDTIIQKHKVVQCFADDPNKWSQLDCGRRILARPRRIRTLRSKKRQSDSSFPLYEEKYARHPGYNASVLPVNSYHGLPIDAVIYLCSEQTNPFDVHVARTHCRGTLYVVNCTTCLFALQRKPPYRLALNPFK